MKTYTAEEAGRELYRMLKESGRDDVIDWVIGLATFKRAAVNHAVTGKYPAGELIPIQPYLQESEV